MNNSVLYYSVGPLLYCPANSATIASSIITQKFRTPFSLALCLEDTIADAFVSDAEQILAESLEQICRQHTEQSFYLPRIFIRVRNPLQMLRMTKALGSSMEILTGFILPKFSPENASDYIHAAILINERSTKPVYVMPIYEHSSFMDLRCCHDILYTLKDELAEIEPLVLNIRTGGNDLCHLYGLRRHDTESIHKIMPVARILSDIMTVYGTDYVVSGPVWEYYNGSHWKEGLIREIADDQLCGFTGKTVIHPNQIEVVNNCYRVSVTDYNDAKAILNWNGASASLVSGNTVRERMNEHKTHSRWAMRTLFLAEAFGIA